MGRQIYARLEYVFDEDNLNEIFREDGEERFTDDELLDYILDTVVDDIYDRVKYNTVSEAVKILVDIVDPDKR